MTPSNFYITTPIYYVNGLPHIGHAYTTIAADVLARTAHRQLRETFFATGSDENSLKNVEAAKKAGKPIEVYIQQLAATWQKTWCELDILFSTFIRTTSDHHKKGVLRFWETVKANGDLYKSTYKGLYCEGCEAFLGSTEVTSDGLCPTHLRAPKEISEENYFFRVSKYRQKILAHIADNPEFIQPQSRRNEIIAFIESHFDDVSVSRQSLEWGIPVPGEPDQVIYVWFDALINYLTAIGYGWDDRLFDKYWPADIHLVGKDIIKFHCALWPAMLMSAGLPLPRQVWAHGFFTVDGQKIGKSMGNSIDPLHIAAKYSNEGLRYYLLSRSAFGNDGDFSFQQLEDCYNNDLANTIGNLASRVSGMANKYFDGQIAEEEHFWLNQDHREWALNIPQLTMKCCFKEALDSILEFARVANKLIEDKKPWTLAKEGKKEELRSFLSDLASRLAHLGLAMTPYFPKTGPLLLETFSQPRIAKIDPLFPKREI